MLCKTTIFMINTEQVRDIIDRLGALRGIFDIDAKLIEITNEEEKPSLPTLE